MHTVWPMNVEIDSLAKGAVVAGGTAVITGLCLVERYERVALFLMIVGCSMMWIGAGIIAA